MNRLGVVVLGLWAVAAGAASASSPDPKDLAVPPGELSRARELVRRLGSEAFREREDAEQELAKMGRLARPVLAEAAGTHPNPEVRARTARLLPRAEAEDLQARVETFLADADGRFEHDLPAWKLFREKVGSDRAAARELYAEIIKTPGHPELLAAVQQSPVEGGRAIADRRTVLFLRMNPGAFGRFVPAVPVKPQPPVLAEVAALLFAETVVPAKDIPRGTPFVITGATFVTQQVSKNAINNPGQTPHAEPYRAIVVEWVKTRVAPEDLNNITYVANELRAIPETTPLLRRVVTTDGVFGWAKGQALTSLVQRNGKGEGPFLKSLLKNDSEVTKVFFGPNGMGGVRQYACQLRDVALALLVVQTGQDLKSYGYEFPPNFVPTATNIGIGSFAFPSDEARDAAFKKWEQWEATHKDEKGEPKKDEKK